MSNSTLPMLDRLLAARLGTSARIDGRKPSSRRIAGPDRAKRGSPLGRGGRRDAVGLDVVLDIEENYSEVREGIPTGPRELLREYLRRGRLGRKAGHGFYDYEGPSKCWQRPRLVRAEVG
jgi:3-hydroxyacyl-CoA dehydrogenase, C-terminal domain